MIYKFRIVSDEVDSFRLEVMIDSDETFLRLRNVILESVGYSKDEIDSFFICDDEWARGQEITLMEMDTDSTEDFYIMEDTALSEFVEDEGQKLLFTYDYINDRSFFMEMTEMIPGKSLSEPYCSRKEGNAPVQIHDINKSFEVHPVMATTSDDLDEEFYGQEGFEAEELESLESYEEEL